MTHGFLNPSAFPDHFLGLVGGFAERERLQTVEPRRRSVPELS